ncbi:glycosyltransferase family 2 protein [Pseudomonas saxonica]|uniref:Glycosyltransferase family 2 protein n=1 Tax=Pseudomonas saxonica TaxID=2600598 RepID=A0ABY3GKU2_9PSED|nr:glycosyltransferase family 2 protein [Pseudomonas saxonica]TWR92320.1 glycosyltransferase family 2 protein [Pseudomonas saxonica]
MSVSVSVAAVVVLYKPDLVVLQRLLLSVIDQVKVIYIIDNTPSADLDDYSSIMSASKIRYHPLYDNLGIAFAHNKGFELAKINSNTHVLLLDQDSELSEGTVATLLTEERKLIETGIKVAAIGPVFIDDKTGDAAPVLISTILGTAKAKVDFKSQFPVQSTYIISSGSLIQLETIDAVGGMQEDLFIDWVDIEWGERASLLGYNSYLSPLVSMKHSIGDEFVRLLGRKITLHSDFRNYFIVRNAIYLALWSSLRIQSRFQFLRKVPYYLLCYTLTSDKKIYSFKLLCGAIKDGVQKKMHKGRF